MPCSWRGDAIPRARSLRLSAGRCAADSHRDARGAGARASAKRRRRDDSFRGDRKSGGLRTHRAQRRRLRWPRSSRIRRSPTSSARSAKSIPASTASRSKNCGLALRSSSRKTAQRALPDRRHRPVAAKGRKRCKRCWPRTPDEVLGCNTRADLAAVDAVFRRRKRAAVMERGVTIELPETVLIDPEVTVGADTRDRAGRATCWAKRASARAARSAPAAC